MLILALAQASSVAIFESELWPGKGLPVFAATTDRLTVYEEPDMSAKRLSDLSTVVWQTLSYDDTRYRTIRPGRFLALRETALRGWIFRDVSSRARGRMVDSRVRS